MPEPRPALDETKALELAMKIRESHHNSIWEEQKHFTWLLSILLSAQLFVFASDTISSSSQRVLGVCLAIVGAILAVTGFRVQRREGEYFRNANALYVASFNALFTPKIDPPPATANKSLVRLLIAFVRGSGGVRDYFQVLFLGFFWVFVGLAVFALRSS